MAGIERILGKPDKAPATAELTELGALRREGTAAPSTV
jgi:hypothetical protein